MLPLVKALWLSEILIKWVSLYILLNPGLQTWLILNLSVEHWILLAIWQECMVLCHINCLWEQVVANNYQFSCPLSTWYLFHLQNSLSIPWQHGPYIVYLYTPKNPAQCLACSRGPLIADRMVECERMHLEQIFSLTIVEMDFLSSIYLVLIPW